jgi:hypothetical protein
MPSSVIHASLIVLKSMTIGWKFSNEFFHLIGHDRGRLFADEL